MIHLHDHIKVTFRPDYGAHEAYIATAVIDAKSGRTLMASGSTEQAAIANLKEAFTLMSSINE